MNACFPAETSRPEHILVAEVVASTQLPAPSALPVVGPDELPAERLAPAVALSDLMSTFYKTIKQATYGLTSLVLGDGDILDLSNWRAFADDKISMAFS